MLRRVGRDPPLEAEVEASRRHSPAVVAAKEAALLARRLECQCCLEG
jgi:hypothetical protein